jgi:hypothetical protein
VFGVIGLIPGAVGVGSVGWAPPRTSPGFAALTLGGVTGEGIVGVEVGKTDVVLVGLVDVVVLSAKLGVIGGRGGGV